MSDKKLPPNVTPQQADKAFERAQEFCTNLFSKDAPYVSGAYLLLQLEKLGRCDSSKTLKQVCTPNDHIKMENAYIDDLNTQILDRLSKQGAAKPGKAR